MNKIYAFAVVLLLACSSSDDFREEKRREIFIDYEISRDTLYLYGDLDYLQNFLLAIDGDTTSALKKHISYGEHVIHLSLIDIWGDTLNYNETILVKEPLSITLLSPVDSFPDFSVGDTVVFEYRINDEKMEHAIYACQGLGCIENDSLLWDERFKWRFKTAIIPDNPVFWGVMTSTGKRTEIRSIWPKN